MARPGKKALIADLPRGITVRKTKNSTGTDYFRVELRERFTARKGRSPISKNFKTLGEARDWIFGKAQDQKTNHQPLVQLQKTSPAHAFDMKPDELAEAARAVRLSREKNITLSEVVQKGIAILRPDGGHKTVSELVEFCEQKFRALLNKGGCSKSHYGSIYRAGLRFSREFGNDSVNEISHALVEDWMADEFEDASDNTTRYYARYLHIVFNEAVDRKWATENPLSKISRQSISAGDIEFLSPDPLIRLLYFAQKEFPWTVRPLAIKAFAGLRTSEVCSLTEKEIGEEQIEIKASKAKTRKSRAVTISAGLNEWLIQTSGKQNDEKLVNCGRRTWFTTIQHIVKSAEINLPKNGLRHSFGTFHFHQQKNENLTATEMGNTRDTVVKWYKAPIVSKADVKAYWEITPAVVAAWAASNGLAPPPIN